MRTNELASCRPTRPQAARRGTALVVCIFVVSMTSVILVSMLEAETLRLTALRNASDYDRALYLAGAAAHEALAELETDPTWRTGVSASDFPSGSGGAYTASVADSAANTAVISAGGSFGGVTRRLTVTVYLAR